ncbi:MAG: hypothetical protein ABIF10_07570 [Candidatus Woesearchaeota archaeon]
MENENKKIEASIPPVYLTRSIFFDFTKRYDDLTGHVFASLYKN